MAWLTVCTYFIYAPQQSLLAETEQNSPDSSEKVPVPGSTEEKNESSNNNLSEYLHRISHQYELIAGTAKAFMRHNADIYLAYHPELHCPPPNHSI